MAPRRRAQNEEGYGETSPAGPGSHAVTGRLVLFQEVAHQLLSVGSGENPMEEAGPVMRSGLAISPHEFRVPHAQKNPPDFSIDGQVGAIRRPWRIPAQLTELRVCVEDAADGFGRHGPVQESARGKARRNGFGNVHCTVLSVVDRDAGGCRQFAECFVEIGR